MGMKSFDCRAVSSFEEAATIIAEEKEKAVCIAGGTDLLGILKDRVHDSAPEVVLDLKPIKGYVVEKKGALHIGAMTTLSDIVGDSLIQETFAILAEAARVVGSRQIRNMGTIGGNLCQEPRCWYYRTPQNHFHCLRKGGEYCGAIVGENRYHSIFGGVRVAPPACSVACPGDTDVPSYFAQIRLGKPDEAARIVLDKNPMPAVTGRVCPHTCEAGCNRADVDEAVSIREIERVVGDHVLAHARTFMQPPKTKTRTSVAVIGSGPAGLAAAYFLRKAGHQVTVFEALPEAGGMLSYTIPAYRLPREVVQKQIEAFRGMGITFKLNTPIGKKGQPSLRKLREEFDAVFVASGAWQPKPLKIEHAELLPSGIEFLAGIGQGKTHVSGSRVLVIGGGNVAIDVAISALRLGASEVSLACLEDEHEMPAFPEEIEQARKEGVKLLLKRGPQRILTKGGRVSGLELVPCLSVFDGEGRFAPRFDLRQGETIHADHIVLAIGQTADLSYLGSAVKSRSGLIAVDAKTGATGVKNVFAGGEVASGASSVVEAMAAGRRAAEAINALFSKKSPAASKHVSGEKGEHLQMQELPREALTHSTRSEPIVSSDSQKGIATEDRKTWSWSLAQTEAKRCMNCSCVAVCASDLAPVLVALGATIKTTRGSLPAADLFAAVSTRSTTLAPGELITEIIVPTALVKSGAQKCEQRYQKFRIRNAIDFPIVSLASVLTIDASVVADVRLVLGAVAPVPLRLTSVEEFLKGKSLNRKTIDEAASLATRDTQVLTKNRYKVQIVKALVERALLSAPGRST